MWQSYSLHGIVGIYLTSLFCCCSMIYKRIGASFQAGINWGAHLKTGGHTHPLHWLVAGEIVCSFQPLWRLTCSFLSTGRGSCSSWTPSMHKRTHQRTKPLSSQILIWPCSCRKLFCDTTILILDTTVILAQTNFAYPIARSMTEIERMPNLHSNHFLNISTWYLGSIFKTQIRWLYVQYIPVQHVSYTLLCFCMGSAANDIHNITLSYHKNYNTLYSSLSHSMLGAEGSLHCFHPFISTLLILFQQHNQIYAVVHIPISR